jgi:acetoin utilization deacetylase AcuC-like enzyme
MYAGVSLTGTRKLSDGGWNKIPSARVDIDIDGVELAFNHSNRNRVMTASFHKYTGDLFPGTGKLDENGAGLGKYFCLNVSLQDGIDDDMYLTVFKTVIGDTVTHFQPTSIVLHCCSVVPTRYASIGSVHLTCPSPLMASV